LPRDVFNEKPSKEDIISATEEKGAPRLYQSATIHTTVGDVHLELFPKVSGPLFLLTINWAKEEKGVPRLYQSATIHTTVGDVHLELFPKVSGPLFLHTFNWPQRTRGPCACISPPLFTPPWGISI
jgi:hypothetical protein